jgi:hypothetical protein
VTLPFWLLYLAAALAVAIFPTAFAVSSVVAYRHARWRRRQERKQAVGLDKNVRFRARLEGIGRPERHVR